MAKLKVAFCFIFLGFLGFVASAGRGRLVGGWSHGDSNDKTTQDIFKFIQTDYKTRKMNANAGNHVIFELQSVEKQLVAGMNYKMVMNVKETRCSEKKENLANCKILKELTCDYKVYDVIWRGLRNITYSKCEVKQDSAKLSNKGKGFGEENEVMPGGHNKLEPGDPTFRHAVEFAMDHINGRENHMYRLMPTGNDAIKKATRQVVAGNKYSFVIEVAPSSCRNNDQHRHAKYEECPVTAKDDLRRCTVEVLFQSWMTPQYSLIDLHCDKQKPLLGQDNHDMMHPGVFENFKQKYGKTYKTQEEEAFRYKVFKDNMLKAQMLQGNDTGSAKYGATQFADLTDAEFRKWYLTPKWDLSYDPTLLPALIPKADPPAAFDWRKHNAVTPVKNQGQCGSCWAFSTTGNIEGQWAIKKGKLVSLSEQELVDCDKLDDGCEGGLPSNAYNEIRRLGGLETEKEYPYDAQDDKCTFKLQDVRVYINGSLNISTNEADMKSWLAKNGPISIGINAMAMQFYFGGVSHPPSILCNPDSLDHGVLIVGYGTEKGWLWDSPFWIVKNSWGASWGEAGYYRVYRGGGTCGLNKMPTSALIK